jgi:16S rRNA (guanine527-N7)-methyltransferase
MAPVFLMTDNIMSLEEFQKHLNLPEPLLEDLKTYVSLLKKWQKHINLVSTATVGDVWHRHVLDSAQLYHLVPGDAKKVIDLGSGAGFPGLVLALYFKYYGGPEVHLVEADNRKCSFLTEVSHRTNAGVIVHASRAESISNLRGDVITARALAPLHKLIKISQSFDDGSATYLFLKGAKACEELTVAQKEWTMNVTATVSQTLAAATIFTLKGVKYRE